MMVSLRPLACLSVFRQPLLTRRTTLSLTSGLWLLSTTTHPCRTTRTIVARAEPVCYSSSFSKTCSSSMADNDLSTGYLDANSAAALDQELMSQPGFSLEQLMELAGLSVAEATYAVLQPHPPPSGQRVLVVCGPGNNGGDGLVAARHLVLFGFQCTVVYPKQSKHPHFINLIRQCHDVGIKIVTEMQSADDKSYNAIVDAIFGFSFKGEPREPFAGILREIQRRQKDDGVTVLSVDVPSGWNVDEGDVAGMSFTPDVLISLTVPKLSAKNFHGRHFVGGRFLPPALGEKYGVRMPNYPGVAQVVEVTHLQSQSPNRGWEQGYAEYLAEKEAKEFAAYAKQKPSEESWEAQYAAYLAEKESSQK